MPPQPCARRVLSSRTRTVTLPSVLCAFMASANSCGVRSFGGVFTQSRASDTASATVCARLRACCRSLPRDLWCSATPCAGSRRGAGVRLRAAQRLLHVLATRLVDQDDEVGRPVVVGPVGA